MFLNLFCRLHCLHFCSSFFYFWFKVYVQNFLKFSFIIFCFKEKEHHFSNNLKSLIYCSFYFLFFKIRKFLLLYTKKIWYTNFIQSENFDLQSDHSYPKSAINRIVIATVRILRHWNNKVRQLSWYVNFFYLLVNWILWKNC